MSKIAITELYPVGSAFFSEPENFLNDFTNEAILTQINGGSIVPISILSDIDYTPFLNSYSARCYLFPE